MQDYETLQLKTEEKIGWIMLNREKALNALNKRMINELGDVVEKIQNDPKVGVGIIIGGGHKAFSAGADLQEIKALTIKDAFDYSQTAQNVFNCIEKSEKPIIACVNGIAMGGGAELALSCHLRVASKNAKLSFPEAGLGGIPGMGGTQRLPRLIGKSFCLYFLLTGKAITAEQGYQLGIFHKVVDPEEVESAAEALAKDLLKKSPLSMKSIIQAVTIGSDGALLNGLALESALMAAMSESEDKEEGIKAIFEKRLPSFSGK